MPTPAIYLMQRPDGASDSTAVARLLALIFGKPILLEHHKSGAPFLPQHPDHTISISHAKRTIAVALVNQPAAPLGIDVEDKTTQAAKLLERYSSAEERALLTEYQLTPLHLWCAKEAAYKAYSYLVQHFTNELTLVGVKEDTLTLEVRPADRAPITTHVRHLPLQGGTLLAYTAPCKLPKIWLP